MIDWVRRLTIGKRDALSIYPYKMGEHWFIYITHYFDKTNSMTRICRTIGVETDFMIGRLEELNVRIHVDETKCDFCPYFYSEADAQHIIDELINPIILMKEMSK